MTGLSTLRSRWSAPIRCAHLTRCLRASEDPRARARRRRAPSLLEVAAGIDPGRQPPRSNPESLMAYAHHEGDRGDLEAGLLSHLDYSLCWLLNRMDKNVMQASVEARVPFLEPDVVKLV